MEKQGKLLGILLLMVSGVFAQDSVNVVNIIGRVQKDAVLLRIGPSSPNLWQYGNQYGYAIERFTVVRNNEILKNRERKRLTPSPLKPLPLAAWESIAERDQFAEIAAQAIYGETFELDMNYSSDIVQIYNKVKETESRYAFALTAADFSQEVAKASGLFFRDTLVKENERYLYRVYSLIPPNLMKVDTGFVYLNMEAYYPLPEIKEVQVQPGDQFVKINWNVEFIKSEYSAYWIERSEDGKIFSKITRSPLVNIEDNVRADQDIMSKRDSIVNNKTYWYRIMGLTPFGEIGPPTEPIEVVGYKALKATPAITRVVADKSGKANVTWTFADDEPALSGFEVQRSSNPDDGFKTISGTLTKDQRTFLDASPISTNYYRIKAFGSKQESAYSFPYLFQMADSVAPIAPSGLRGTIDTTGIVRLTWTENQEMDLEGYRVYRANFKSAEFTQITSDPVAIAEFSDTLDLRNLTSKIYYKIQAVDNRYNPSPFSAVLRITKPDVVPPPPPSITSARVNGEGVLISWVKSAGDDIKEYRALSRKSGGAWSDAKRFLTTEKLEHKYALSEDGFYDFKIVVADSTGNISESSLVTMEFAANKAMAALDDFSAKVDRSEKRIRLSWTIAEKGVQKIVIYRATGEEPLSLFKTVSSDQLEYSDAQVVVGTSYTYLAKPVFKDGTEGSFTKKIIVNF